MITYQKLAEKFIDKGYGSLTLFFMLPQTPFILFDPSLIQRQNSSREKLKKEFDKRNEIYLKRYKEKLEELDVWIDYQKHIFD